MGTYVNTHIADALRAAQQGDEQDTMKQLSRLRTLSTDVGKWVLSTATAVGVQLLVTILKQMLHLPSAKSAGPADDPSPPVRRLWFRLSRVAASAGGAAGVAR